MNRKSAIRVGLLLGSVLGGYVPLLWGTSFLSFSSVIFGSLGALLGIYIGFKVGY